MEILPFPFFFLFCSWQLILKPLDRLSDQDGSFDTHIGIHLWHVAYVIKWLDYLDGGGEWILTPLAITMKYCEQFYGRYV